MVVAPAGFEPTAYGLGNRRSILLSYGAIFRHCKRLVAHVGDGKRENGELGRRLFHRV